MTIHKFAIRVLIALAAPALCLVAMPAHAATQSTTGFVYVATNNPCANVVVQYRRAGDGSLTKASQAATGGLGGTGNGVGNLDPLGSQDSDLPGARRQPRVRGHRRRTADYAAGNRGPMSCERM